jgi:hypothetical protein
MESIEHNPERPGWRCRACGEPWPCPARRSSYLAEFAGNPVGLTMLMAGWLAEAARDLGDEPARVLYARMLGWLHEAP